MYMMMMMTYSQHQQQLRGWWHISAIAAARTFKGEQR